MKILFINVCLGSGSTGKIVAKLATQLENEGNKVVVAYGTDSVPDDYNHLAKHVGRKSDVYIHALSTRLFDNHGLASKTTTKKFLKWVEEYNPDLLWLHNIHGYYINYELLFDWIKSRPQMPVKWTLHDCWAFTGHCAYFSYVHCEKWKMKCKECTLLQNYPQSFLLDRSEENYEQKKHAFTNVTNMELIVPSEWLKNLVKESFLKAYKTTVIYNNVDSVIFHPTNSEIREKLNLQNKFVILGVANIWSERKGLDDFIELASLLDNSYAIVLIGLSKQQIKKIPPQIIGIQRTEDIHELVKYYSMADVFVNPSKEETFGLTTIEAEMCGTPSIVYEGTACEEIAKKYGGKAVNQSVNNIYHAILEMRFDSSLK